MGNKLEPIVFVDDSIKKEQYIAILDQYLLEFIDALRADGLQDIKFHQDNARPHTANLTRDWLKVKKKKKSINTKSLKIAKLFLPSSSQSNLMTKSMRKD